MGLTNSKTPEPKTASETEPKPKKPSYKCYRPGPVVRNCFFNFLRHYREQARGDLSVTQIAQEGARVWHQMPEAEKIIYKNLVY